MKKLIALLLLATLVFGLVANGYPLDNPNDPTTYEQKFPILGRTNNFLPPGTTDYVEYKPYQWLDYTVINTSDPKLAQLYFTVHDDGDSDHSETITFNVWQDIDTGISTDPHTKTLSVSDFGIYLYDPDSKETTTTPGNGSVSIENNISKSYTLTEGQSFVVYYTGTTTPDDTNIDPSSNTYTTIKNWVGSNDNNNLDTNNPRHTAVYSDYFDNETLSTKPIATNTPFFCLYQESNLEWDHWEFGFVTTRENLPPVGSPLPGTWATLAICGLCASAFRKRKNAKR